MALNDSPFTVPPMECKTCGRYDHHLYCQQWIEWLRVHVFRGDPWL